MATDNVFFFFPPDDIPAGQVKMRNALRSPTHRWIFDPKAKTNTRVTPHELFSEEISGEFSRIDDRYVTKKYNHFWQALIDPTRPYNFPKCGPPAGGMFNVLGHLQWDGKKEDLWWLGDCATVQEPTFIPKNTDVEGEGYVIALINRLDERRNDIAIWDALNVSKGPLAVIHLPFKLRLGLHGNFVDERDIEEWKQRRSEKGDVGPVKVAEKPLPWQEREGWTNGHGVSNGGQNGNGTHT